MAAMAWCNVLEGFLRGVSTTAIDARALARVRLAFPHAEIGENALDLARPRVVSRIVPSTKRKGQSFKYLEAVFGCEIDSMICVALRALVSFRNDVTHPDGGRAHDEHEKPPSSEEWVAWSLAVRALAGVLIRALADRLDERRAAGEVIPLFPQR